jgi:hypothetical protein
MRSSTVLRWVHLLFGLMISVYFLFMPDGGWPDWVTTAVGNGVVGIVAWNGIARWQLPRLRRWRARRRRVMASEAPVKVKVG